MLFLLELLKILNCQYMHYIFGFASQQVQRISTHSLSYFWTQCNV